MKKILSILLSLVFASAISVAAQTSTTSTTSNNNQAARVKKPRGPVFRATKDQIKQAQAILKTRGFYNGEQTGKLDDDTRAGLKKYQTAENMKATGTLNKSTLVQMGVELTERQKTM